MDDGWDCLCVSLPISSLQFSGGGSKSSVTGTHRQSAGGSRARITIRGVEHIVQGVAVGAIHVATGRRPGGISTINSSNRIWVDSN